MKYKRGKGIIDFRLENMKQLNTFIKCWFGTFILPNLKSLISTHSSTIHHLKSKIYNLKSLICTPSSKILNPKSKIYNLKSIIFFLLLSLSSVSAQQYPVQGTMAVMAPYPAYLSDYANGSIEKLVLNLTLTDINLSNKQVKLRLFIQSQNTIIAKSNTEIINEPTLILDGGVPQRFTSTELAVYFNLENLQGITQATYSHPLPEGVYTFGFEVFDYFTGNKLSGYIQQLFWLTLSDPPLLNMPSNNENISNADPNNPQITFQWTPRGTQVSQTEYTFTLSELWDDEGNASQQFLAAIPKHQTTTNNTTLIYGISDPPLLVGRTYAWRVQAKAKVGLENVGLYRQEGFSNIFIFKYGGQCPMVENVKMEAKSYDRIYISWDPAPANNSLHTAPAYTVAARKYTSDDNWQWVEFQTPNTYYNLVNIEANTEYEIKVGNNCPSGTSTLISYTLPQRITTLENGQVAGIICGQVPAIDLTNQNLIERLSVNDVVMAGDFVVVLISVSGDQNGWSGEAWTKVKWLGDTKIKLKYKSIKVNTDKRLVGDGYFETTYDPSGKNIADVDKVIKDISEILKYANDAINKAYRDIRQNIDDKIIAKQFFDDLLEAMNDPKSGATQEQKDFIRKNKKKLVDAFSDGIKKLREKIAKEGIPEDLVKENLRSSFVDAGKQVQSENLKSSTFVSAYAGYNQLYSDTGPVKQAIFYLGKYKYTVSFKKDVTNVTDTNFELEGIKYVVTLDRSTKKFYRFLNLLEFEKAKTALGEKAKDGLSIKELEAAGVTKLADNNYTIVEEELAPKTQAILEALISRHNRKKVDAIVNLAGYLSDEEFATLTGKDRGACNFDFNNKNLQYSDECLDELISKLNADNFVKDNTPVTVNGIVFDYIEIKKRCAQIKQKLQPIISTLTEEEKLILDLPITQWKVGFKYGAISILHWMEGSGTSIKMPYEYVVSSDRLKGIDSENLKNYFENIRYLSLSNLGYRPSNPDGVNLFLFNESIGAAKKSLDKFLRELKEGEVGNFNNIATTLDEPIDNNNFFTAFPLGSITGDLDDIGASFGRFAQRVYFKGRISKNKNTNAYLLNIVEIATRFADEFSFSKDSWTWWLPSTYDKGQHLGCWRINCNSTNPLKCVDRYALSSNWNCIQDGDFISLKAKAKSHYSNFGKDFFLYTEHILIRDEFIKKTIEIR